jgi:hypothetical protein
MVGLARARLQGLPRRAADEEDVALSAFASFCRAAEAGRFPRLCDRLRLSYRLRHEDIRINVLRSRAVRTASFEAICGDDLVRFAGRFGMEACFVEPEEVGRAALALCSGWLEGVRGQVITVDRGATFLDDLCGIYRRRDGLGL